MSIQIRRANNDDIAALLGLHGEVHEVHLRARADYFKFAPRTAVAERLREQIGSTETKVFVAEFEGNVAGYAVAIVFRKADSLVVRAREWCEVDEICVAEAFRRRGIATALLQAVVEDARAAGIRNIELNTWAFNMDAQRAFKSFGFVPKNIRFELKK